VAVVVDAISVATGSFAPSTSSLSSSCASVSSVATSDLEVCTSVPLGGLVATGNAGVAAGAVCMKLDATTGFGSSLVSCEALRGRFVKKDAILLCFGSLVLFRFPAMLTCIVDVGPGTKAVRAVVGRFGASRGLVALSRSSRARKVQASPHSRPRLPTTTILIYLLEKVCAHTAQLSILSAYPLTLEVCSCCAIIVIGRTPLHTTSING